MKPFSKIIFLTLGFGVLAVVLSSLPSHPAAVAASNIGLVSVTNTPLPVTGSVAATITGTPTVNAQQSGAWNVGITGTPSVNVGNTSANPVPVQAVHRTVVQVTSTLSCNPTCAPVTLYSVPTGKQLVVEYVNFLGQGDPGGVEALFFVTPNGNISSNFIYVPIKSTGLVGFGGFIASENVKFYGVGGDLTVQLYTTGTTPAGNITISGYLEDAL